jgi:ATP-binding cassette subfamily B multidrug efflux pump
MRHLQSVNKYFLRYKWHLVLGMVFITLSNVFGVLSPQVIRDAIDLVVSNLRTYQSFEGFAQQEGMKELIREGLLVFAITFIILAILKGLFMFLMRQTIIIMSRHVEYDQKNELYAHYQRLTPAFYKRNNTGDLMSRVAEDVGRVRMYVGPAVMYFLNLLVLFALVITTMIRVNPTLTLYVLLPLPVLSLSIYYVNNLIEKRSERIQRQLSTLTSVAQETYSGIRVIKSYAQEGPTSSFFEENCETYKERSLELARVDASFQPLMVLLIGLSTLITIFAGGVEVMKGTITAGNVAEFVIYVNMLTWPVTSLGWVASIVQRAAVSQRRIDEFLDTKPEVTGGPDTWEQAKGRIVFSNVSFTYPDTSVKALQGVNFTIEPGEKVAIVGRTGSGKSTIADLLVRMYDVNEGIILLDDQPIEDYSLKSLREHISYVPQDVFLFGDTVEKNIRFGLPVEEAADVSAYARYASIDKEIELFRNGYDTMVGERGVTLSGGQKQRVSIARAFAKEAPVIILDDCLSAVDAGTEKTILSNMDEFLRGRTSLVITHRISGLTGYDRIIVMDNHRIAETGTHSELMAAEGLYSELYNTATSMDELKDN